MCLILTLACLRSSISDMLISEKVKVKINFAELFHSPVVDAICFCSGFLASPGSCIAVSLLCFLFRSIDLNFFFAFFSNLQIFSYLGTPIFQFLVWLRFVSGGFVVHTRNACWHVPVAEKLQRVAKIQVFSLREMRFPREISGISQKIENDHATSDDIQHQKGTCPSTTGPNLTNALKEEPHHFCRRLSLGGKQCSQIPTKKFTSKLQQLHADTRQRILQRSNR